MSAIGSASPASAFAAAGMASAGARFGAAASAVVSDPTRGGLAEAAVAVTESKVAFEASARVADVADQMQGVLVDLLA
jgi:hypothetical protein